MASERARKRASYASSAREREYRRGLSFKHRYNISMDEVFALFEKQGYSCALCGVTAARKWNLDHDHVTGRVRGILCSKCNNGLSALGDDLAGAEAAVDYLRNSCGE